MCDLCLTNVIKCNYVVHRKYCKPVTPIPSFKCDECKMMKKDDKHYAYLMCCLCNKVVCYSCLDHKVHDSCLECSMVLCKECAKESDDDSCRKCYDRIKNIQLKQIVRNQNRIIRRYILEEVICHPLYDKNVTEIILNF
jgi:hypothetical protein